MLKWRWLLILLTAVTVSSLHAGSGVKEGEIGLEGEVVSVDVAGRSFTVNCYRFGTPNGVCPLNPPKRKVATVDSTTSFFFEDGRGHRDTSPGSLSDLRPGECVYLQGKDTGSGQPVPARHVDVSEPSACEQRFGARFRSAVPGKAASSPPAAEPEVPSSGSAPQSGPSPAQAPLEDAPAAAKNANLPLPLLAGAAVAVLVIAGGLAYVIKLRRRE